MMNYAPSNPLNYETRSSCMFFPYRSRARTPFFQIEFETFKRFRSFALLNYGGTMAACVPEVERRQPSVARGMPEN